VLRDHDGRSDRPADAHASQTNTAKAIGLA
jgi:hypothetical protein